VAGVDVGAHKKGFHVAVLDDRRLVDNPRRLPTPGCVIEYLSRQRPVLVAVDGPMAPAPDGARSRIDEQMLAAQVCNIRWTPDRRQLASGCYYEWIRHGFQLYRALAAAGLPAIECFPTASFSRWYGQRAGRSRARWSQEALVWLGLRAIPVRSNQDERDAIAAAVTAWQHTRSQTEAFGTIVVPSRLPAWQGCRQGRRRR
jgi:predicted nuclease with RNAse H fold